MKRIAVIFPGAGYNEKCPLLRYTKNIAVNEGYEIFALNYGDYLDHVDFHDEASRSEAFRNVIGLVEEKLKVIDFKETEVLFISKSYGTIISSAFQLRNHLKLKNIMFTPVYKTLDYLADEKAIVFFGSNDPWIDPEKTEEVLKAHGYLYHKIENANHSLETGDVFKDLELMKEIMTECKAFITE